MAMNGMDMMFKSMGIDIDGIKRVLNPDTVKRLVSDLETVSSKLNAIDEKLTRIEIKLETIPQHEAMNLLSDGELDAREKVNAFVREYNSAIIS